MAVNSRSGDRLPPGPPPRIICLGLSALDVIWHVDQLFAGGSEKIRASAHARGGGGMAATAAVAVARLGGRSAFWGRAGQDGAGEEMRRELAAEAVDTAHFRLFPDGRSSVSGVIVDRAGERQIANFPRRLPDRGGLAAAVRDRGCIRGPWPILAGLKGQRSCSGRLGTRASRQSSTATSRRPTFSIGSFR